MSLRTITFLLILLAPITVFASTSTSYPINLMKNQNWIISITAEESTALDTQDFFIVGRQGESFIVKAYEIDLKTGVKKESRSDYDVEYMRRYTDPKDLHFELSYCWYSYPTLQVDHHCHYFRIPIEIKNKNIKGDESFDSLLTGSYDDFEVEILEKDDKEIDCNLRGKVHDEQAIYYTKESDQFEKLGTFACFTTEQDAKQAGYRLNFAEGGEIIDTSSETNTEDAITNSSSFPDVTSSHTNYTAINFLQSQEVISGYDNGNFGPDDQVTRVQALKILLLGSDIDPDNSLVSDFPDIESSHWCQRFVAEAKQRDIVNGDAGGTFRPDDTLNLAEALKMLLKTNNISPEVPAGPPFMDVDASDWFASFASYAKEKGLVDAELYLYPNKQITRGELAELMYRLMHIRENRLDSFL